MLSDAADPPLHVASSKAFHFCRCTSTILLALRHHETSSKPPRISMTSNPIYTRLAALLDFLTRLQQTKTIQNPFTKATRHVAICCNPMQSHAIPSQHETTREYMSHLSSKNLDPSGSHVRAFSLKLARCKTRAGVAQTLGTDLPGHSATSLPEAAAVPKSMSSLNALKNRDIFKDSHAKCYLISSLNGRVFKSTMSSVPDLLLPHWFRPWVKKATTELALKLPESNAEPNHISNS